MGQKIAGIATLIVIGVIVADLVLHPAGTATIVNGVASIWRAGIQGASGQKVS